MHTGALFAELIATHYPSTTRESISSLQKKTSDNASQWFSTFYSPFLLCLPRGDAGKKVSCCSLKEIKMRTNLPPLNLLTLKKIHQFRSQVLQGLDLIFGGKKKQTHKLF